VVLPWIHEAGNPYFDAFFGSPDAARRALCRWMGRPTSEVAITRVTVLLDGDRPVGCFVALSGADLARCLRADSLAAIREAGREGRRALLDRARGLAAARVPVPEDAYFLSKLAVAAELRGAGLGRALLEKFLAVGRRGGFSVFRTDARPEDAHIVHLYESAGFRTIAESATGVLAMVLVERG
jgi:ribosomal protein S18 acetylase RimI-like enzyme